MAQQQLPCDGDGNCMVCKNKPTTDQIINCKTCITPWHLACLSGTLEASPDGWDCPDCSQVDPAPVSIETGTVRSELIASIRAIENDSSLTDQDKAVRRQQLLSSGSGHEQVTTPEDAHNSNHPESSNNHILQGFSCSFCMQLPERPVTVRIFLFDIHCLLSYIFL